MVQLFLNACLETPLQSIQLFLDINTSIVSTSQVSGEPQTSLIPNRQLNVMQLI